MNWLAICTLLCMPDRFHLTRLADSAGVPANIVLAIAWQETRANVDPAVRGKHGEIGRFQWKLASAAWRCPGLDITRYRTNIQCTLVSLKADIERFGVTEAIRRHNGTGPTSKKYLEEVLATLAKLALQQQRSS